MEQCLKTNEICPIGNKKCKNCKLEDCKETINMIETEEQVNYKFKIKCIKEQLPEQCKNCSFLIITNVQEQKVYCPYRINERCVVR